MFFIRQFSNETETAFHRDGQRTTNSGLYIIFFWKNNKSETFERCYKLVSFFLQQKISTKI